MDNHQLVVLATLAVLFLPGLIASFRKHNSRMAIGTLNFIAVAGLVLSVMTAFLLGIILVPFTGLMWLIALIWSLTGNVERKQVVPAPAPMPPRKAVDPRWSQLRSLQPEMVPVAPKRQPIVNGPQLASE